MAARVVVATRHALHPLRVGAERALWSVRRALGWFDPEDQVIEEAQRYWTAVPDDALKNHSHWRGAPAFAGQDEARWLGIGAEHLALYHTFARAFDLRRPVKRIVEWGCGGGVNVTAFAGECEEYVGVEVSPASLEECAGQATEAGVCFTPVLVGVSQPEAALASVPGGCQVFLSTYVFELLPSQRYGLRLLRLAHRLLAPGGLAVVQIKYATGRWWTEPRRFAYSKDPANVTTYRIDEFWSHAQRCGFARELVHLAVEQPLVGDGRYAYFGMLKGD